MDFLNKIGFIEQEVQEFIMELIEQHRTVYTLNAAHCKVCDGASWYVRYDGDPEYMCKFWSQAEELKLVA